MIALASLRPRGPRAAGSAEPCIVCGRETNGEWAVRLTVSGDLAPVAADVPPAEDQGWFPIGPDCAKKLPPGYVWSVD